MHLTRRKRRVALISVLLAVLAFAWVLTLPPAESEKAYAFLEQHPWLCQVVRLGFVLAGKQDEFDLQIAFATFNRYDVVFSVGEPLELPSYLHRCGPAD